jgi:hypothetical protein
LWVAAPFGIRRTYPRDHHIFSREDIREIINIQPRSGKAKSYQVKQVREIIFTYQLEVESQN